MAINYHSSARLTERCWCYVWQGRGNNCNTVLLPAVLRGGLPHVLIDPGSIRNELGEPCFDSLTAVMERDGFRLQDVGLVIGTHCHPDHIEATGPVVEGNGALFAMSAGEEDFYRSTAPMFFQALGVRPPELDVSFYLGEGDLQLGAGDNRTTVRVLLTPGHSPGSVSLYLQEDRILITGDVVFAGSVGRTDFPGGSPTQLRQSIDKLSGLDAEYLVAGHSTGVGGIIAGRDNVRRNFAAVKMFI